MHNEIKICECNIHKNHIVCKFINTELCNKCINSTADNELSKADYYSNYKS